MFYICACLLPFVAAAHSYSVEYGFRGLDRSDAKLYASTVFYAIGIMVSVVSVVRILMKGEISW